MGKVDFKKSLACYQAPRGKFEIVDVPPMQYLMIDGHGDPNTSPAFGQAIEALYPVAYKLKFASKQGMDRDYVVPPLEGLWWAEDMDSYTVSRDKAKWDWTLMIMTPEWIDRQMFDAAVENASSKTDSVGRIGDVRLASLDEGKCVQTLHIGSFEDESAVLDELHKEFVPANGLTMNGKHHEIYFSDIRKVAPDKMRTLLRQPVV